MKQPILVAILSTTLAVPVLSHAETLKDWLMQSQVSGDIRSYYFNQLYGGSPLPDKYAYSLGGMLRVQTAPVYGISAAVALYTANDLGANDTGGGQSHLDPLLMGDRTSLNVLGQAYLQYQNPWVQLRVGNLLLDTPWMNPSDAFMIPSTFQAVAIRVTPIKNLQIIGIREFRFKNRIQADYQRQTLLNFNDHYSYLPDNSIGTLAFGLKGHLMGVHVSAWFYRFYSLTNMFYGTLGYTTPTLMGHFRPFADFQYAREWANGAQLAGPVNATVYGGMAGIQGHFDGVTGQIFAAYDQIPSRAVTLANGQTLYNGGFISPYTQQYSADPLYTSIMDYGLVDASASGHAWKFGFLLHPLRQVRIKYSYSIYDTAPYLPNVDANYLDVTYSPGGFWKGLSLRNRLALDHSNPYGGYHGTFIDDRLMLQYSFS